MADFDNVKTITMNKLKGVFVEGLPSSLDISHGTFEYAAGLVRTLEEQKFTPGLNTSDECLVLSQDMHGGFAAAWHPEIYKWCLIHVDAYGNQYSYVWHSERACWVEAPFHGW